LGIQTLGFSKNENTAMHHYQGASYVVLQKIMKQLPHKQFVFTDIGCGMGRVLFVAEQFGYKNLIGIEFNGDLLQMAHINESQRKLPTPKAAFHWAHCDARVFNYANAPQVYFLFNPFNAKILTEVLLQIGQSMQKEDVLVYMNPIHHQMIPKDQWRVVKAIRTNFYTEALVYHVHSAAHKV